MLLIQRWLAVEGVAQGSVKSAEALQVAKEVGRADVLQARVEVEAAAIELQNARNRHTAACRRLAAVVGVPDVDMSQLQGDLEAELQQLTWDDALSHLLSESPEIAQAQAGVERARWALQRECAGRIPNIDTQASIQYDASTGSTITSASIGMPLPVFAQTLAATFTDYTAGAPSELMRAGLGLYAIALFYVLAHDAVHDHASFRTVVVTVVLVGVLEAAYGVFNLLAGNERLLFYRRWAYHDSATGTLVNRNHFALLMALVFPLTAI